MLFDFFYSDYETRTKSLHPIERIALFHLEFEGIHPFIDGNGRTGRLLLNLDLIQKGYPPINIKFADRSRYYDAFDAYFGRADAAPMIELICGYVTEALDQYLEILAQQAVQAHSPKGIFGL